MTFFYDFLRVNFGQRIVLLFFFFWFNKKVLVWLFKCKFWPKRTMQVSHICFMRLLPGECTILQVHNSLFFFLNVLGEKKKGRCIYIYIYIYIYLPLSLSLSKSKNASSTNAYCKLHHIFRCFKERPTQWYTHFVKSFVTQLTPHGVSNDPLPYCNWFFFSIFKGKLSFLFLLQNREFLS